MTTAASLARRSGRDMSRGGKALLGGAALLCVLAIIFLISEIIRELSFLSSASSDNVHWVLSQTEVEFLEFHNAVNEARAEPDETTRLDELIVEFDVFYSRMTTLGTGALYEPLREIEGFGAPVSQVRAKLDALIPLIDGPRDQLRAQLELIDSEAMQIRPLLRRAATSGLQYFAEGSDLSRSSVSVTLLRLATLTVLLVLTLVLVLRHTLRVRNQIERRGQELADAYARQNTILETSLDAVIVSDMTGKILNFNAAAERIFDYRYDEVFGRNIADIIIPDHFREAHTAGMKRMHDTGVQKVVGHGRIQLEAKRRNGQVFPVEFALEKANAGDDEIVVAFLRDISRRVAAEQELVDARDKALAGEQAKTEFLAMMTHEIRTPLNGLLGNLSLLEKTKLTPAQDRYLRNMGISGAVLMRHVDSVLDVARFESGASVSQQDIVHLGQLLQDIVDGQASAAQMQGNHMQWGWIGTSATWVQIDAARLQQILLNLVGNAIKFTENGRILIEAEQSFEGETRSLDIRVIDTGTGISPDDQERIFTDFQTLDHDTGGAFAGTGLGLGIARRFVQAMGGEIGVESAPGEGSVFWFRVPLQIAKAPAHASTATEDQPGTKDCHILLVEDNEINLQLAHEMLVLAGHKVTEARNGQEAVQAAAAQRFDLILMDIRMPVLDGLGATRAIRQGSGANKDTPVVAFSANVLPEARDRFLGAGMSGFLPKPLTEVELEKVISRFCGRAPLAPQPEDPAPRQSPAAPSALDELRDRYLAETQELFDWLNDAPEDLSQIADRAHQVAGSAAAFGQPELGAALIALETAAESGDQARTARTISAARSAWQAAPEPRLG